jgi:hypothetical protein
MTCGRCKGLMVDEWRPDFSPETFVWRCINCGSVTDPLIEQNRRSGFAEQLLLEESVGVLQ